MAGELGIPCLLKNATSFVSKWVGGTSENLKNAFSEARELAASHPKKSVLLVLDEIDGIGQARRGNGSSRDGDTTVTTLISELDGLQSKMDTTTRIITIGTTNFADSLDAALTRPGRLGTVINFKSSTLKKDIESFLLHRLKHHNVVATEEEVAPVAEKLIGKSPAYLKQAVEDAFSDIIFSKQRTEGTLEILPVDVVKAMQSKIK